MRSFNAFMGRTICHANRMPTAAEASEARMPITSSHHEALASSAFRAVGHTVGVVVELDVQDDHCDDRVEEHQRGQRHRQANLKRAYLAGGKRAGGCYCG